MRIGIRLLWIVWIGIINIGYAQNPDTAIVTGVQQEIKIYANLRSILSPESFPDYFKADTVWQASILSQVRNWVQQKFGVKEVTFSKPGQVTFFVTNGSKLNIQPEQQIGDLLVNISNSIQFLNTATDNAGMVVKSFNYNCRIQVKDKKQALVFNANTVIPFRTAVNPDTGMYGTAEISAHDLKQLFEEAVAAAFENKAKKLSARIFYRPAFNQNSYHDFIGKAEQFSLQESMPDIPVQKGERHASIFIFKPNTNAKPYQLSLTRTYTGNAKMPEQNYTCRAEFSNELTQTNYKMWAELRWKNPAERTEQLAVQGKPEVFIRCMADRLLVGDFTLSARKFEGLTGYKVFTVNNILPKNTIEIRINNQVKAIIQKGGIYNKADQKLQQYNLYLSKNSDTEERGELLTIFMIYKVGFEFGQDFM